VDLFALLIAVVAIAMAWTVRNRAADSERRLAALEDLARAGGLVARLQQVAGPNASAAEPPPLPSQPPTTADAAASEDAQPPEPLRPEPIADAAPSPPPPPPGEPAPSFEERFGTQWTVWVGGLALALGGIFLVRYSIEQGLLGPGVRTFLGGLMAAALLAAGEWTRRNEIRAGFAGLPTAHVPSILTAAGTAVAYATIYAAYALYGFIGPAAAFVLLGIVALATLGAALLHGPALAGLGLVGAYVTPLLVSTGQANFWALYLYLVVVTAAAFGLARTRLWRWLAITAVVLAALWTLPGLGDAALVSTVPHAFYAVACFALAAVFMVCGLALGPDAEPDALDGISWLALAAFLLPAALVTVASGHDTVALAAFWLLAAAAVAIAWRAPASTPGVPVAAVLVVLVLIAWAVEIDVKSLIAPSGPTAGVVPDQGRAHIGLHLIFGGAFAALFGAAGFFAQGRAGREPIPLIWAVCAVATPIAILIALYYRIYHFERSIPFAGLALLLAAVYALATDSLSRREPRPGMDAATAFAAVGCIAALALALTLALEKGWLTVALALMVPGIAYVAQQRPVPMLRVLAAAVGVLVLLRVGIKPHITDDVGTTPIFNWILYGYGVPAAAFWLAAHLLRKQADDVPCRTVESLAITFTALLCSLQIRHYVNSGDIYREASGLTELALQVSVALAMAIGLERVRLRTQSMIHDVGALVIAALAVAGIVFGLAIAENPLFTGEPVGSGFVNRIMLGYGLTAVLAITLALTARHTRPIWYRIVAAVTAVGLSILYLSLEVRRLYHGDVLTIGPTTDAEWYTYSAVWLAYGVVLLLIGILLRSQPARLASAAVIILTIAKVFVYDMAGLTGIFRALSFIGLGLVLVGIGYLYQRLLFPRRPPPPSAGNETVTASS
jgi:uncharacterized membrane protein